MSIRKFMNIFETYDNEYGDDEEDDYQEPKPEEYILQAGTTVYHGTNGKFSERHGLNSPAWVSDHIDPAKYFATWKTDEGKPRISVWTVRSPVRLAVMTREYLDYCHEELMYEEHEDILAHLARQGFEGWIIPDNYGHQQADILLADCDVLDYVKTTKL